MEGLHQVSKTDGEEQARRIFQLAMQLHQRVGTQVIGVGVRDPDGIDGLLLSPVGTDPRESSPDISDDMIIEPGICQ